MASKKDKIVIPGERLEMVGTQFVCGHGTYAIHNYIYSSLAGVLNYEPSEKDPNVKTVEVRRNMANKHNVPFVGAIVTCKITQATSRFVKCSILCVEDSILSHAYTGMIRKEDIREHDKDSADVFESYRTSDIVLARVISLGDSQSCVLTTAEENLGVVSGRCPEDHKMIPKNFSDLFCATCQVSESRKVAKVPLDVPNV